MGGRLFTMINRQKLNLKRDWHESGGLLKKQHKLDNVNIARRIVCLADNDKSLKNDMRQGSFYSDVIVESNTFR